jgi:hypothetical protein
VESKGIYFPFHVHSCFERSLTLIREGKLSISAWLLQLALLPVVLLLHHHRRLLLRHCQHLISSLHYHQVRIPHINNDTNAEPATKSEPALTGTAAVFAQLNQGADVTKGLRKVDKSEMTHKNPSLRAGGSVPARTPSPSTSVYWHTKLILVIIIGPTSKTPTKPKKPVALQTKKPAKWELQGNKWVIVSDPKLVFCFVQVLNM